MHVCVRARARKYDRAYIFTVVILSKHFQTMNALNDTHNTHLLHSIRYKTVHKYLMISISIVTHTLLYICDIIKYASSKMKRERQRKITTTKKRRRKKTTERKKKNSRTKWGKKILAHSYSLKAHCRVYRINNDLHRD